MFEDEKDVERDKIQKRAEGEIKKFISVECPYCQKEIEYEYEKDGLSSELTNIRKECEHFKGMDRYFPDEAIFIGSREEELKPSYFDGYEDIVDLGYYVPTHIESHIGEELEWPSDLYSTILDSKQSDDNLFSRPNYFFIFKNKNGGESLIALHEEEVLSFGCPYIITKVDDDWLDKHKEKMEQKWVEREIQNTDTKLISLSILKESINHIKDKDEINDEDLDRMIEFFENEEVDMSNREPY